MDDERQDNIVLKLKNENHIQRLKKGSEMEQYEKFYKRDIKWKEVRQRITQKDMVIEQKCEGKSMKNRQYEDRKTRTMIIERKLIKSTQYKKMKNHGTSNDR